MHTSSARRLPPSPRRPMYSPDLPRRALPRQHHQLGTRRVDLPPAGIALRHARRARPRHVPANPNADRSPLARHRARELDVRRQMMRAVVIPRLHTAALEHHDVIREQGKRRRTVPRCQRRVKSRDDRGDVSRVVRRGPWGDGERGSRGSRPASMSEANRGRGACVRGEHDCRSARDDDGNAPARTTRRLVRYSIHRQPRR